jgi:hypothetical protein
VTIDEAGDVRKARAVTISLPPPRPSVVEFAAVVAAAGVIGVAGDELIPR